MNLKRIHEIFLENFEKRGEVGAAVSIWKDGREVLSLAQGYSDRHKTREWTPETLVLVWSCTKGLSAACLLHCLHRNRIRLETEVSEFWPEFGQAGKDRITIAELLSHRAGLSAIIEPVSAYEYEAVIDALCRQEPLFRDGHGYHPRTYGFLLDELLRRITHGESIASYWRRVFGEPLGLDIWIGLPESRHKDAADVLPARGGSPDPSFAAAIADPNSLTSRAFVSPRGLTGISQMNAPEARSASFPAFGGYANASDLARFYWRLMDQPFLEQLQRPLVSGFDHVLRQHTSFSAGMMKDPVDAAGHKLRRIFGPSTNAFGHPGAGGSVAFADPDNRITFAYVMNQMEQGTFPNDRAMRMIQALYEQ